MAVNIKPLHDRVIVRRIEVGEQARGGIIIPDTAKEKPQEGEVVAVGEGKYREDGTRQKLDVQVGDRVLFGKYSGSEVKIEDEELLIMREEEILGLSNAPPQARKPASNPRHANRLFQPKTTLVRRRKRKWQSKLFMAKSHARLFCAVSTNSPMQSRSRSDPKDGTL